MIVQEKYSSLLQEVDFTSELEKKRRILTIFCIDILTSGIIKLKCMAGPYGETMFHTIEILCIGTPESIWPLLS